MSIQDQGMVDIYYHCDNNIRSLSRLSLTTILSCAFDARCKNRLLRIKKRLEAADNNAVLFQSGQ